LTRHDDRRSGIRLVDAIEGKRAGAGLDQVFASRTGDASDHVELRSAIVDLKCMVSWGAARVIHEQQINAKDIMTRARLKHTAGPERKCQTGDGIEAHTSKTRKLDRMNR